MKLGERHASCQIGRLSIIRCFCPIDHQLFSIHRTPIKVIQFLFCLPNQPVLVFMFKALSEQKLIASTFPQIYCSGSRQKNQHQELQDRDLGEMSEQSEPPKDLYWFLFTTTTSIGISWKCLRSLIVKQAHSRVKFLLTLSFP